MSKVMLKLKVSVKRQMRKQDLLGIISNKAFRGYPMQNKDSNLKIDFKKLQVNVFCVNVSHSSNS